MCRLASCRLGAVALWAVPTQPSTVDMSLTCQSPRTPSLVSDLCPSSADSLGSFIREMLWPRRNIWASQSPIRVRTNRYCYRVFFFSIRLPLSASARKDVSFRVLWLGNTRGYKQGAVLSVLSEDVQEQEKILLGTAPNLKTSCTKTLFYERHHFSPGVKGMGYMDVPPLGFSTTRFARSNAFMPSSSRFLRAYLTENCGVKVKP